MKISEAESRVMETLWASATPRSAEDIVASIRTKLFAYPDDARVVCGHGPSTTIGTERATKALNSAFCVSAVFISVAKKPGAIAFTVMWCGPNSSARQRAMWRKPALEMP